MLTWFEQAPVRQSASQPLQSDADDAAHEDDAGYEEEDGHDDPGGADAMISLEELEFEDSARRGWGAPDQDGNYHDGSYED